MIEFGAERERSQACDFQVEEVEVEQLSVCGPGRTAVRLACVHSRLGLESLPCEARAVGPHPAVASFGV